MMAESHFTGSVRLYESPYPLFGRAAPAYARQSGRVFWIREPDRPGYRVPVADAVKLLAKNVRLERALRGWSQETLAELAGLNRTFVGAIERCEQNSTLATVEKLAKAFDLSVAELLTPHTFNT